MVNQSILIPTIEKHGDIRYAMQDWAEEHLLIPALSWAQERRMGAVLRSFSPTLTHRSDGARGSRQQGRGP